ILSSGSTELVPSPVIHPTPASKSNEIPERNPHQPPIPYPSRLNKDKLRDKSNIQIHKFLQMFKKLHFNINFAEALAQMLKYAKMLKDLLTNKEKLILLLMRISQRSSLKSYSRNLETLGNFSFLVILVSLRNAWP
ncbi:hypothetical protein Tco_1149479, partial [Tanacetum coccineum]